MLLLLGLVSCGPSPREEEDCSEAVEESDGNDSPQTAIPVTPGQPVQSSFALGCLPLDDPDFYVFTAEAGHRYSFTCSPETAGNCELQLRNESNTVLAKTKGNDPLTHKFETGGKFYVRLTAVNWSVTGAYSWLLEDLARDDHGDTEQSATARTPSAEAFSGRWEVSGDKDVFTFPTIPNHVYRFSCTLEASEAAEWSIHVTSSSRTVKSEGGSTRSREVISSVISETVVAQVTSTGFSGAYTCRFEDVGTDDHADTALQATEITVSETESAGRIDFTGDVDVFFLTATPRHIYRIICKTAAGSPCSPVLKTADGTPLFSHLGLQGTTAFEAPLLGIRDFFLHVSGDPTVMAAYTLRLEDQGVDDHGNGLDFATPYTGNTQSGRILPSGDSDFFTFNATAGHVYALTCTTRYDQGFCGLAPLILTNLGMTRPTVGRLLIDVYSSGLGAFMVFDDHPIASFEEYELFLEDLGPDDHGDEALTATPGNPGEALSGIVDPATDRDYFSLPLQANRQYVIKPGSPSVSMAFRVFAPDGSMVPVGSVSIPGGSSQRGFTPRQAGTHFLEVTASDTVTGSYQITVQ